MKNLIYFLGMILLLVSCQRENIDEFGAPSQVDRPNVTVQSSVVGFVIDENGEGISDAIVGLGAMSTTTNQLGLFSFDDVLMSQNSAYLQVEKDGFFAGSRKFSTEVDGRANVRIQMIEKELIDIVNTQAGGTVSFESSSIELPDGNYTINNGTNYNGDVEVYAKWLDPTASETFEQMPGELTGIDAEGNLNALATYGMIAVELISDQGDYLNLPEGQTATIKMEVPDEMLANAPNTIPLWHFNEATGNWEEEGEAALIGNEYVGEVGHFSFWNCDAPFPLVEILGNITLNREPLVGAQLKITDLSTGFCAFGYTGDDGFFLGKVPEGDELLLTIYGVCGEVIDEISIGPFYEDTEIADIELTATAGEVTVYGTFENCEMEEIESAFVFVEAGAIKYSIPVNSDGTFEQVFPGCTEGFEVNIYGVDLSNALISEGQIESFSDEIELDIVACDDFLDPFFFIDYEGLDWDPTDSMFIYSAQLDTIEVGAIEEYIVTLVGVDFITFLNEFVPVFESTFLFNSVDSTVEYFISLPSQGFALSGNGAVEVIQQGGTTVVRFTDTFMDQIEIFDTNIYPGNVQDVQFDISFQVN